MGLAVRLSPKPAMAVVVVATLTACAAMPVAADAISLKRADKIAKRTLKPKKQDGRVVLLRDKKPVPKGKAVFEAFPKRSAKSDTIAVKPLRRKAWLYWLDLEYGARFQHRSKMLLVDKRTGRRMMQKTLLWWPVVGGRLPRFLGNGFARYLNPRKASVVYSSVPIGGAARSSATAGGRMARPTTSPHLAPDAFKNDCVVAIGLRDDKQFEQDFKGIYGLNGINGLRVFQIRDRGTDLDGDGERDIVEEADGKALKRVVAELTRKDCTDILIYIDGHGAKNGISRVEVGFRWEKAGIRRGEQRWRRSPRYVTSADIEAILEAFPQTTFKLKIDACYSSRFILDVPIAENPNLLITETSSLADELSYSYLKAVVTRGPDGKRTTVPSDTDNPGNTAVTKKPTDPVFGRGEFTNGNLAGITRWLQSKDEIDAATQAGGSLFARMLDRSFELGASEDFARKTGLTTPRRVENIGAGDDTPPGDGAKDKCEDGNDNDGDGAVDADDPGCRTGPGGAYDPDDHGEDDVGVSLACPGPASGGRVYTITQNNVGSTMVRHLLRLLGTFVVERASSDADFASGSVTGLSSMCSFGTTVSVDVSWTVSGTTVVYEITMFGTTGTGGDAVPASARASTR